MPKYIYEDKQAWKAQIIKNYQAYRKKADPTLTDEYIEKKADEMVNDEKYIKYYKKFSLMQEKGKKEAEIYERIQNEIIAEHGRDAWKNCNGFARIVMKKIDISDTPEAYKKNKDYILKLQDRNFAMKEIMKEFKKALNTDFSKYHAENEFEAFDLYEKNQYEMELLFNFKSVFDTVGNYTMSKEFKDLFDKKIGVLESFNVFKQLAAPFLYAAAPTCPKENPMLLMACAEKISINNLALVGKYEGFTHEDGASIEKSSGDCIPALFIKQTAEEELPLQNFIATSDQLPKNFLADYKCMLNGKEIKVMDGISALKNGQNVEFVPLTDEEKQKQQEILEHALLDQPGMKQKGNEIRSFYKTLKATDHWYNWFNSKEFGNTLDALKELSNNEIFDNSNESFRQQLDRVNKLAQAYVTKYEHEERNTNRQLRFDICREIVRVTQEALNDDYFHRIDFEEHEGTVNLDMSGEVESEDENELDKSFSYPSDDMEAQNEYRKSNGLDEVDLNNSRV